MPLFLSQAIVIHTAHLMTAIDMASLIDSYCIVYTDNPHSRLTGIKRFSDNSMQVVENTILLCSFYGVYRSIVCLEVKTIIIWNALDGAIPLASSNRKVDTSLKC